jgi:hypothetical protein
MGDQLSDDRGVPAQTLADVGRQSRHVSHGMSQHKSPPSWLRHEEASKAGG